MKKLHFVYEMKLKFSSPVTAHSFALRCTPRTSPNQAIGSLTCEFHPVTSISVCKDAFANKVYTGYIEESHSAFSFRISGMAITNSENIIREELDPLYKYSSLLTHLNMPASAYFADYNLPAGDELQQAIYLMNLLYEHFRYQSGSTNCTTKAEDALLQGCGVCQDYAHILIALCRQIGIAARYVAGFMIGEGATHAWLEIYTNGQWIGLDPTHNRLVDEQYIKLSHGRDYNDCIIDRGRFMGNANQYQTVIVRVEEIPNWLD